MSLKSLMYLRALFKSQLADNNIVEGEEFVRHHVKQTWENLTPSEIIALESESDHKWSCDPNRAEPIDPPPSWHVHTMCPGTREPDPAAEVPVIGNFGVFSRDPENKNTYTVGKRIVAAQLAKQFATIPSTDPFVNSLIPPQIVHDVNKITTERVERLTEYAAFSSEEDLQTTWSEYRQRGCVPEYQERQEKRRRDTISTGADANGSFNTEETQRSRNANVQDTRSPYHLVKAHPALPNTWIASVALPTGGYQSLGKFSSEYEAAVVHDVAAKHFYGENAVTNFDEKGQKIENVNSMKQYRSKRKRKRIYRTQK